MRTSSSSPWRVAERVVDVLQVVEVEGEHGALVAVAVGEREFAVELLEEPSAVQQAGQWIMIRQVLELPFESFALGRVLELVDPVERLAVGVAHDRAREVDPHVIGAGMAVAKVVVEDFQLAVHETSDPGEDLGQIVGMHERVEPHRQQLLPRVARDRAECIVDLEYLVGMPWRGCDNRHPDARALEGAAEALVGLSSGCRAGPCRLRAHRLWHQHIIRVPTSMCQPFP